MTKAELFVHLHGMLFTKIALDDFDECLARFLERLRDEGARMHRTTTDGWSALGEEGAQAPFGDAEWFMLATTNIAALLQYGAEDGVLRKHTQPREAAPTPPPAGAQRTPQAIMLNPASGRRSETPDESGDDVVITLSDGESSDDPLVFRLAQKLAFGMLDLALAHPFRIVGDSKVPNPYIILVLTFVASLAQHPSALRHLERALPWAALVDLFNSLPSSIEVRLDAQSKLLGSPLPEDWCIRGMDWTGKHVFGRGYWKTKTPAPGGGRRDEMLPPPITGPPSAALVESEMDALKFSLDALDEFADGDAEEHESAVLANARWRRVAVLAAWLVRAVPGLDFDANEAQGTKFRIGGALDTKLRRWRKEDDDAREAERRSREDKWERDARRDDELDDETEDDDDDDDEDPTDSDAVRELKVRSFWLSRKLETDSLLVLQARRRELKAIVRQARQTRRPTTSSLVPRGPKKAHHRPTVSTFPGFTVLVFDTNILLTSLRLFCDVLETETWTVVVPLAGRSPFFRSTAAPAY